MLLVRVARLLLHKHAWHSVHAGEQSVSSSLRAPLLLCSRGPSPILSSAVCAVCVCRCARVKCPFPPLTVHSSLCWLRSAPLRLQCSSHVLVLVCLCSIALQCACVCVVSSSRLSVLSLTGRLLCAQCCLSSSPQCSNRRRPAPIPRTTTRLHSRSSA